MSPGSSVTERAARIRDRVRASSNLTKSFAEGASAPFSIDCARCASCSADDLSPTFEEKSIEARAAATAPPTRPGPGPVGSITTAWCSVPVHTYVVA